jgi:hypothetical protein
MKKKKRPRRIQVVELNELKIPEDVMIMEIKNKRFFLRGIDEVLKLGSTYYSRDNDGRTLYLFKGELTKKDLRRGK